MIVLNKKTIRIAVLSIFLFIFGIAIISDQKATVPTVSLPISGKTIIIDARARKARRTVQKVQKELQKQKQT